MQALFGLRQCDMVGIEERASRLIFKVNRTGGGMGSTRHASVAHRLLISLRKNSTIRI
jgi:hypothetical protein